MTDAITNVNSLFKTYTDKVAELESIKKSLQTELQHNAKEYLESYFQEVFDKHPGANAFHIRGYTPYFNDGDACVFGLSVEPVSNEEYKDIYFEEIEEVADNFDVDSSTVVGCSAAHKSNIKAVKAIIMQMEDLFKLAYEDHFHVFIYRDFEGKVNVLHGEYEHD